MTETPILDQLLADPKFEISQWPRDDLCTDEQRKALEEPWPDPYVVLPPSPEEAQRVVAERAGWDEGQMQAHAARAHALMAAEQTIQLITIEEVEQEYPDWTREELVDPEPEPEGEPDKEPEPDEEPEPIEEKDNVE